MDDDGRAAAIRARLLDVAGPDPGTAERALLCRLLHSFVRKAPGALDDLESALRRGAPGNARAAAHTLRGAASNVGADTLAALAAGIEDETRAGRTPPADPAMAALRAEAAAVLPLVTAAATALDPAQHRKTAPRAHPAR